MEEHQNVNEASKPSETGGENKKAKLTSNHGSNTNQRNDGNGKNRKRNNKSRNDNPDTQLSKSLSWLLRHTAPSLGLRPTSDGYIPLNDILSLNHPRFRNGKSAKYTVDDVRRVVENCEKQRFRLEYKDLSSISSDEQTDVQNNDCTNVSSTNNLTLCIRANQGHSYKNIIECDHLLTPITNQELSDPNLIIVHGTTRKAWEDHIRIEGLSRMKRNHIHFAAGLPYNKTDDVHQKAPISGMRATSQIYIYINGNQCAEDGIKFFRSDNGVILTAGENDEGLLPVKYFRKVVLASTGKILLDNDDEV